MSTRVRDGSSPARISAGRARPGRPAKIAALLCAAAGLVLTLALPEGVFSGDEGVKLAQSQALVHNGWRSVALPYLGSEVDPEGRYFPITPPFAWFDGSRWFGIYSFEYAAAGAVAWWLGGLRGVFLLSWLGAALALWALADLAGRTLRPRWAAAAVAAVAAGTPLLLYGTTNYEHTWGCALVFCCLALLAGPRPGTRRLLASGALLGTAFGLRPELFAFPLGVAGFALVYWGPRRRTISRLAWIAAGAAAVAGLHLLLNVVFFGSIHPGLGAADHPLTTWRLNLEKLVSPHAPAATLWIVVGALAIGLLPGRAGGGRVLRAGLALGVAGLLAVAVREAMLAVDPAMTAGTRTLIGLFTATPLAVLGLLRGPLPRRPEGDLAAALATTSVLFVAAVVAVKVPGFWGGLEMGSRYLLPAAPLLVIAGLEWIDRSPGGFPRLALGLGAMILLLVSTAATVVNTRSLHAIRQHSARLVASVAETGVDDVVAGKDWAPLVLAPLYLEKRIYSRVDDTLFRELYVRGRRRFVAVERAMNAGTAQGMRISREHVVHPQVVVFGLSVDPMTEMLEWIEANVPPGAGILREEATPAVDSRRYRTAYRPVLGRVSAEFLTRADWDYVLVAAETYGRFLEPGAPNGDRAERVARGYEQIFGWPLAVEFETAGIDGGSRVALYRVERNEARFRRYRRWRAAEASWVSDETIRPRDGEGPLPFTRRWQVAAFKGRFEAGRYEIRLISQPRRAEAYLHAVAVDHREVGSFRVGRRVVVDLPRRDTYLLRVFLRPGATLSAVTLRPASPAAAPSPPLEKTAAP